MEDCAACLGFYSRSSTVEHLHMALEEKYSDSRSSFYKKIFMNFIKKDYSNFFDKLQLEEQVECLTEKVKPHLIKEDLTFLTHFYKKDLIFPKTYLGSSNKILEKYQR